MTVDGFGFPPLQEWRVMGLDSRFCGNDEVDLRGNNAGGVVAGVCDVGIEFNLSQPEHVINKLSIKSTNG